MYTIGLSGVFSLTGWCRQIQPGFLLSRPTQDTRQINHASRTGLSPSAATVPTVFRSHSSSLCRSYNPAHAVTCTVWAVPLSLATTHGITVVFSSCGYLDVSVPHVRLPFRNIHITAGGLPHSDIRGSIPLAGPRGFSQLGTSFFASESLGIPRAPLFTYSLHTSPFCLRICAVSVYLSLGLNTHSVAFSAQHVNELMAPFGDI